MASKISGFGAIPKEWATDSPTFMAIAEGIVETINTRLRHHAYIENHRRLIDGTYYPTIIVNDFYMEPPLQEHLGAIIRIYLKQTGIIVLQNPHPLPDRNCTTITIPYEDTNLIDEICRLTQEAHTNYNQR